MLARNYIYARLRVHAVQCDWLLRLEVDETSPPLALIQTWLVRPLIQHVSWIVSDVWLLP